MKKCKVRNLKEEIAELLAGLCIHYLSLFRSLLVSETERISKVCNKWEEKLMANAHLINEEIPVQAFSVGES